MLVIPAALLLRGYLPLHRCPDQLRVRKSAIAPGEPCIPFLLYFATFSNKTCCKISLEEVILVAFSCAKGISQTTVFETEEQRIVYVDNPIPAGRPAM